ncbi:endonuclease/exonuclease/phosphatase family protein [Pseudomonas oryzihabitans]|uniref:endonuclease/exonuclease/phosphatase family protein n=1 Tax=Pseudomonas oryzihabitans TaxID=47885 RepID=UPI002864DC3E|nr:endonuclease/exonuclease/phosphatase family protein [Pseudomonas psychrotolerans]MDR6680146.1 endonuclease/exonuclease/phosphatase family metal-dependent hydrolase [Pseudomonas psychrotolerans]
MDFKVVWWNCHLSAPSTRAKKRTVSPSFLMALNMIVADSVDLLCLCEVSDDDLNIIAASMVSSLGESFQKYKVQSLYRKSGNSIDDFAVVYNCEKINFDGEVSDLNGYADVTNKKLKVGQRLDFHFLDGTPLWVILCHWQSRKTYEEHAIIRESLGSALRAKVNEILSVAENSLVLICGDFNDEPFSRPIEQCLIASRDPAFVRKYPRSLFNPFWKTLGMDDLGSVNMVSSGTCYTADSGHVTTRRTFDQIILSSGFLGPEWRFLDNGVAILYAVELRGEAISLEKVSDHYPVVCNLKRSVL